MFFVFFSFTCVYKVYHVPAILILATFIVDQPSEWIKRESKFFGNLEYNNNSNYENEVIDTVHESRYAVVPSLIFTFHHNIASNQFVLLPSLISSRPLSNNSTRTRKRRRRPPRDAGRDPLASASRGSGEKRGSLSAIHKISTVKIYSRNSRRAGNIAKNRVCVRRAYRVTPRYVLSYQ